MSNQLPDSIFPAVAFFENDSPMRPTIFTILVYNTQSVPLFTAWFHEGQSEPITIYNVNEMWFEKRTDKQTIMSKIIGNAIEIYNPFK